MKHIKKNMLFIANILKICKQWEIFLLQSICISYSKNMLIIANFRKTYIPKTSNFFFF